VPDEGAGELTAGEGQGSRPPVYFQGWEIPDPTEVREGGTKYCGHSFRIGATMTAASRGMENSLIMTLGRWCSLA